MYLNRPLRLTKTFLELLLFITAILAAMSPGAAQKLRLRSQILPTCSAVSGSPDLKFADIYADGKIAVQGSYNCRGVFIYDLADPDNPVISSVYDPAPRQAFLEAIVIGGRGYFGSGGTFPAGAATLGDGVHIVDLTDPYRPMLLGKVNSQNGGFNGVHEIVVHGNYLIENYNSTSNKTLKIIDISNPAAPVLKWEMSPRDALWVHAVHVRGDRMYTSGWLGMIEIYDIGDLASGPPVFLGAIAGDNSNHSSWTSEDGDYLYSCRETQDGDLRVYDVRDPTQPMLVRSLKTSQLGLNAVSPHNPVVYGNKLYVSWYQAGVQVFDISDPTDPKHLAQYDTYEAAFAPPEIVSRSSPFEAEPWDIVCGAERLQNVLPTSYDGNWAVYPFLGTDKVLAGDMSGGLYILNASDLDSGSKNRVSDFDGDGRTDLSAFIPSSGDWLVENSSNRLASQSHFGSLGDIPATGDYDGDGRVEFAVFRPSNGYWYLSTAAGFDSTQWGLSDDIPIPGDYDADGRTDIAVWRPSTGVWYIRQSTLGIKIIQWGMKGDKPVVGDYDKDGKDDLTVFRPSDGVWYVFRSSSSIPLYMSWGTSGDRPLAADFDGNGISDFAIYRPFDGTWWIIDPGAAQSLKILAWGMAEDLPVPADYDGDGKTDIAVFRPSTNVWYTINSMDGGENHRVFGQPGVIPSPGSVQPR